MAKWMVAAKKADFNGIAEKYHITPVLARIMRNRDIVGDDAIRKYLYGDLGDLYPPFLMKDMEKAAEIIIRKIREGKKLRIIGDYDVDGICSVYILLTALKELGARVDTVIPHRIRDGYGLNDHLIKQAAEQQVDTIITCDNGIAAASQILLAKQSGMTVIVTDHHEVPFEDGADGRKYFLPQGDAVIDPKQPECTYPFSQICGAVVVCKLVHMLFDFADMPRKDPRRQCRLMDEFLVFAALATVCDVMELKDENRIIVKKGLELMGSCPNLGLQALLKVNGIEGRELTPYHAGFIIGPCLNATGRLDTAERALELFQARDIKDAVTIAEDLKSLNDSRKAMTEEGIKEAVRQVEETSLARDRVLVIYLPQCHESLAGIVAGRIREKYGRPVFVLTKGEEGVKGSGRSIESYNMYEEMTACKELFTRYGGHKMAAGLSLPDEAAVEAFRRRLNRNCTLTEEDFEEIVHIDVPMPLSYVNKGFIGELSLLAPYGTGNPRPLFARKGISLLSGRKMGKNRNVGKYRIAEEEGSVYEMVYFGDLDQFDGFLSGRFGAAVTERLYGRGLSPGEAAVSMVYYPELNSFAGRESIQMVMQYYC